MTFLLWLRARSNVHGDRRAAPAVAELGSLHPVVLHADELELSPLDERVPQPAPAHLDDLHGPSRWSPWDSRRPGSAVAAKRANRSWKSTWPISDRTLPC